MHESLILPLEAAMGKCKTVKAEGTVAKGDERVGICSDRMRWKDWKSLFAQTHESICWMLDRIHLHLSLSPAPFMQPKHQAIQPFSTCGIIRVT
ncbi:hypothetical protein KQX54_019696 [Cotesia glomerata]|uniref:Uncharacterized protein n=1 Tax=Cotesia glomerata TaxID=32391 RepID=A0AAV7I4S2_COTGL|nr:hypothetical protein KQX54_019696 [Cotesia glomerata]